MPSRSIFASAFVASLILVLPLACATAVRSFDDSSSNGTGGSGGSGGSIEDAGVDAPPGPCTSAQECAPVSDACNVGTCINGVCAKVPTNEMGSCEDGNPCTENDVCQQGQCLGGNMKFCPNPDSCHIGVCDPSSGACTSSPGNDGALCDDGLWCTTNDVCSAGSCSGAPMMCPQPPNPCMAPTCDEMTNSCSSVPGPDGMMCNDGDACTNNDACLNGACTGSAVVSCISGDGCCPAGCPVNQDTDCGVMSQPSYDASQTFVDALPTTTMTMTWDGTSFWSCSGGGPSGIRLAQYTVAGALVATYQPNIDFRSVFTKGDGTTPVFAREYGQTVVRIQTSPGVFGNDVSLNGGNIDFQSALVWDASASQFVAFNTGTVTRWAANGSFVSNLTLVNFGSQNNENTYPQNRGIIFKNGLYVTYSNGFLSGWDVSGQRIKQTVLNGAGTGFDSHFSLSYAAGKVWIIDTAGGMWRGYNVGL